jgi:hypothetical protein
MEFLTRSDAPVASMSHANGLPFAIPNKTQCPDRVQRDVDLIQSLLGARQSVPFQYSNSLSLKHWVRNRVTNSFGAPRSRRNGNTILPFGARDG